MEKITQYFQRTALHGLPQHFGSGVDSRFAAFHSIPAYLCLRIALLLVAAFGLMAPLAQAQTTSSGTATTRCNKEVFVFGEYVRVKDAVAINYTLAPTDGGTQITILSHYNGTGDGETSGNSFTLMGTDQQSAKAGAALPAQAAVSSFATLTQVGSTASVRLRIDYLLTLTEDGLIISITDVEVAQ